MSTRSHIGIWNEDGSLDVIYCHRDGYPAHNGAVLLHHYQDLIFGVDPKKNRTAKGLHLLQCVIYGKI